ncbi:MAG: BtrH N-terminal domain-containing protein [Desulfurivibrionaceae bacterium]
MSEDGDITIDFHHRQTAHCESGVVANLMQHQGLPVSEAMVFGMGGGLFFGYFPFIYINGLPLITYRSAAGSILKRVARNVGFRVREEKFSSPGKAMAALDRALAANIPVGLQTGVFWLPYFPRSFRFHFNAHNLVVYGRRGSDYLISDPVFPSPVVCSAEDLARARFAKGPLAPKGRMYFPDRVPSCAEYSRGVADGIRHVCKMMVKAPVPLIGVRGIRFLASRMRKWPRRSGREKAALILGQVVRMQEEIGTGGGGFRFIYAAFLQEAAEIYSDDKLLQCSRRLTEAGDRWREFAVIAARICKGRAGEEDSYDRMADILEDCARREAGVYQELLSFTG